MSIIISNEELVQRINQGINNYSALWEMVSKWVTVCAKKYYTGFESRCIRSGVMVDDLIQEGYFAMLDAVRAYEPSTGYKFITYMRYPLKKRFDTLVGYRVNKHEPLNRARSFDEPIGEDFILGDTIDGVEALQAFEDVIQSEYIRSMHKALDAAMNCLTDDERAIVEGKYYHGATIAQSCRLYDISESVSRNIHYNAMRKLRHPRNSKPLQEYRADIIYRYGYHGTGFSTFKHTGMSSVERTVIKLIDGM